MCCEHENRFVQAIVEAWTKNHNNVIKITRCRHGQARKNLSELNHFENYIRVSTRNLLSSCFILDFLLAIVVNVCFFSCDCLLLVIIIFPSSFMFAFVRRLGNCLVYQLQINNNMQETMLILGQYRVMVMDEAKAVKKKQEREFLEPNPQLFSWSIFDRIFGATILVYNMK